MNGRPEVQHVSVGVTMRIEAAEDMLVQVHGEGSSVLRLPIVNWAGTTALRSVASQFIEQAEVAQDFGHADLFAQLGKVDPPGGLDAWSRIPGSGRRQRLGTRPILTYGTGCQVSAVRGDRFPFGALPRAARGGLVCGLLRCRALSVRLLQDGILSHELRVPPRIEWTVGLPNG